MILSAITVFILLTEHIHLNNRFFLTSSASSAGMMSKGRLIQEKVNSLLTLK